jgi:hypothetical protein
MTTITRSTFYAIAKYTHTHGRVDFETTDISFESYYRTKTFWVSIIRHPWCTHYMVIYRPTGEFIYDVMDMK